VAEKVITIWSDPRWRVLFDVTKLDRVKPWQINLVEAIRALMEELERRGMIDLNSCGVAVYSAATIHRMKTERLLKADVPPAPEDKRIGEVMLIPPPIQLPYMPEFMVVTIGELIQALKTIFLKAEKRGVEGDRALLEVLDVKLDEFLVRIEERLEEFLDGLQRIFGDRDLIMARELFSGVDRLEAARRFILLLFAAARGIVELIGDEECRLVAVRWSGGGGGSQG